MLAKLIFKTIGKSIIQQAVPMIAVTVAEIAVREAMKKKRER